MRNVVFFLSGFQLLWVSVCGQPTVALQQFLSTDGVRNAAVGVSVKRVADGKNVVEYLPEMALSPASLTKLITTAFALDRKGENYCYKTEIGCTGEIKNGTLDGDIVIYATGDPCFDSEYFPGYKLLDQIIITVEQQGIKKVKGSIVICETISVKTIPGSWLWEDLSNYYAAPYCPFNYRDNAYIVELKSGKAETVTTLVSVIPKQVGIEFRNEVIASESTSDHAWIFGGPYSQVMYLQGSIPQNKKSFKIKGAIHRPDLCFVNELTDKLNVKGVVVEGQPGKEATKKLWFVLISPPIKEIVYQTNKISVNLFAEALGKLAADKEFQPEVRDWLQKNGIINSGVILKDACGLSAQNAVPADVFTDLLIWAKKNIGDSFVYSLPVAGVDAGLNGYCAGSLALSGKLKAKTGSFSGVRCLSGYLTTRSEELLAFTIMVNNFTCTTSQLQQAIRNFLTELANN